MFASKKSSTQLVLYCDDLSIRYLLLDRDDQGLFVRAHDEAELPLGVLERGEILKAEAFTGILRTIKTAVEREGFKLKNIQTTLILDNDYFKHVDFDLPGYSFRKDLHKQIQSFIKNNDEYSWLKDAHVSARYDDQQKKLYAYTLSKHLSSGYLHSLEKAGFRDVSIHSDMFACEQLVGSDPHVRMIVVGDKYSKLVELKHGHYVSDKKFQVSYQQFSSDIIKNLNIPKDTARKIVREYGVSRAHKDQKVYARIIRSLTPLVDYLRLQKDIRTTPLFLWYLDTPIIAMADVLSKRLSTQVQELDPLKQSPRAFHEVLSLQRDDSHRFSLLLAQAMVNDRK